jgi:hypothetical protein
MLSLLFAIYIGTKYKLGKETHVKDMNIYDDL